MVLWVVCIFVKLFKWQTSCVAPWFGSEQVVLFAFVLLLIIFEPKQFSCCVVLQKPGQVSTKGLLTPLLVFWKPWWQLEHWGQARPSERQSAVLLKRSSCGLGEVLEESSQWWTFWGNIWWGKGTARFGVLSDVSPCCLALRDVQCVQLITSLESVAPPCWELVAGFLFLLDQR